jgi:hypothetical protein
VPGFATSPSLNEKETGLREGEAEVTNERDYLDAESAGDSHLSMGGFEEGEAGQAQQIEWLTEQKGKMEAVMKDKNQKILELLETIEDFKIQIYSKDKIIDLQQNQIDTLIEDLK